MCYKEYAVCLSLPTNINAADVAVLEFIGELMANGF
jgi:hypothetical protein